MLSCRCWLGGCCIYFDFAIPVLMYPSQTLHLFTCTRSKKATVHFVLCDEALGAKATPCWVCCYVWLKWARVAVEDTLRPQLGLDASKQPRESCHAPVMAQILCQ